MDISKVGVIGLTGSLAIAPFRCTGSQRLPGWFLFVLKGLQYEAVDFTKLMFQKQLGILLAETRAQEGPK